MASGILDVKRARRLDKTGRREAEAESEGEDDSGGESDTDGPDDGPVEGGKAKTDADRQHAGDARGQRGEDRKQLLF